MRLVAGAAWPYAFRGFVLLWSFWLLYPFVATCGSRCNDHAFVSVPLWLYWLCVPFLAQAMFWEYKCEIYLLPVLVGFSGHIEYLGKRCPQFFAMVVNFSSIFPVAAD